MSSPENDAKKDGVEGGIVSFIGSVIDRYVGRNFSRNSGTRKGWNVLRGLQTTTAPVSGVNVMYTVTAPQTSYSPTTLLTALNTAIRLRYILAMHSSNIP